MTPPIDAFERDLVVFGLELPRGGLLADGGIHRIDDGQHPRKRNGAGWYVLHETPTGLLVGRAGSWWRDRGAFKWNSRGETKLRPADRKAIADLTRKIEAERAEHYRQGAERAAVIWAAGEPCESHPYLANKRVKSHGLRVDHDGRLLIPVRDLDGELRGVQRIDGIGIKRFTFGTDRERPTCLVIGNIDEADTVAVVEGYATGATVFAATGWPVVIAFDAGGLEKIARPLRQRLLNATLVFAGDLDLEEKGGTGQAKAKRAARAAGGVPALPPTEGQDWNDHAAEHGIDDVRVRLIAAAGNHALPPTVSLAEGTARLDGYISGFFDEARAWNDLPEEQRPAPPAHLVNVTMAAGKSHVARQHAGALLDADKTAAVVFALPLHRLTSEQSIAFKAETGHDAAVWRGREQPDPERDDGKMMCLELELAKAAYSAGVSVSEVCALCPSHQNCGYQKQREQKSRAWFVPHQLIFAPRPKVIPLTTLAIDEKFHGAGMIEDLRLAASTIDGFLPVGAIAQGDRDLLAELRGMLLAGLKATVLAAPAMKRVRLTRAALLSVGLSADLAQQARSIEWSLKPTIEKPTKRKSKKPTKRTAGVKLTGSPADMIAALDAVRGQFNAKVPTLWKLVEDLLRGEHDESVGIELEPAAKLRGGEGRGLMLHLHHRREVHESWRVPTLLMDATAKPEIVRHWFTDLVALPEIHIEAPHQRVTWVRHSFAKARLVPQDPARSKNPEAEAQYNKARAGNLEALRRFIEVQAARYRTGRNDGKPDVLVVVNEAVEALLRAGRLPSNVAVEHFNNLRGTNAYETVRAVIAVGRTLPDEATIHGQAERMAGRPLDQTDPLVTAMRWACCEAELIQVIGRGRGIRRTEATPLDVQILGDVPLPLKVDAVFSWQQAQPTPIELMAARGVVLDCQPAAKGYWSVVQALLPDVFKDAQAAWDAARLTLESVSEESITDESQREDWLPHKARPHGGRYGIPVLVDPTRLLDLAAVLDLSPQAPGSTAPALDIHAPGPSPDFPTQGPPPAVMSSIDPARLQFGGHQRQSGLTCRIAPRFELDPPPPPPAVIAQPGLMLSQVVDFRLTAGVTAGERQSEPGADIALLDFFAIGSVLALRPPPRSPPMDARA